MRSTSTVAIVLLFTAAAHANGVITTNVFSDITWGSELEAPYSNLVGTLSTDDVQFLTDTGITWHPFGLSSFGADITGALAIPAAGTYTFSITSDDGAELFLDGPLIDDGFQHPALTESASITFTSAGVVPFEILYFQNGVGGSGVDLNLPPDVRFTMPVAMAPDAAAPEPSSLLLAGLGLAALVRVRRR